MSRSYSGIEKLLFPATRLNEKQCFSHFAGKQVVITGASFGIGEQLALLLGKYGADLVLIARTEEKLKQVHQTIVSNGGSAVFYALDLRNEESIDQLIHTITSTHQQIDCLIHCAGLSIRRSFRDSKDRFHDIQRTMAINYFAPVKLSLSLFPQLEKASGQLIYLSAINTLFPSFPKWAAYQASKTAFNEWMKSVGPEMNEMKVATTLIYLPLVKTRMIAPTNAYKKAPAMNPEHAASRVIQAIISRKSAIKPWWTGFAVFGTKLFKSIIRSKMLKQD